MRVLHVHEVFIKSVLRKHDELGLLQNSSYLFDHNLGHELVFGSSYQKKYTTISRWRLSI